MKPITNEFKTELLKFGREYKNIIGIYDYDILATEDNNYLVTENDEDIISGVSKTEYETELDDEDIFSIKLITKGEILSTMMKELDFETPENLEIGKVIDYRFGLKIPNQEIEYINYGKFIIYKKEYDEVTERYTYTCYDFMLRAMRTIGSEFRIPDPTISGIDIIRKICEVLSFEFDDSLVDESGNPTPYAMIGHKEQEINVSTFMSYKLTYRDLLGLICQYFGVSMIVEDNILKLKIPKNAYNKETNKMDGNNELYINNSAVEGDALSYLVDGTIEQDGTPTPDNPVEVKTIPSIINLFDKANTQWYRNSSSAFSSTGNTDTTRIRTNSFAIDGGKTYVLSGVPSGITFYKVRTFTEYGGNVVDSLTPSNNSFTLDSNIKYIHLYFSGSNFTNETNTLMANANIMLEEGSVSHEYIPYGYYAKVKVTGKNLFDKDNANVIGGYLADGGTFVAGNSNRTLYIPCKNNTTYTVSKIAGAFFRVAQFADVPTGGSSWITRTKNETASFITFTTTTGNYLAVSYYNVNGDTLTEQEILDSIQIEENEEPTSYEPYKENQVLIDMRTNNLFNKDTALVGYTTNSSGELVTSSTNFTSDFIKVDKNTDYYVTKTICVVLGYDINKNFISEIRNVNSAGTFNSGQAEYIRVRNWYAGNIETLNQQLTSSMLNKGTTGLPYQPYYYELCKIGDYKDTLSIDSSGNCTINKNIGKVVLNGSETWTDDATYPRFGCNLFSTETMLRGQGYSNYYKYGDSVNRGRFDIAYNKKAILMYRPNDNVNTASLFKTWLSTHNTDVYYVLATPETINLPNATIPLFEGINHVTFVDDLETNTSITYYSKYEIQTLDEKYLKDTNVAFKNKYGKINALEITGIDESKQEYVQDSESINEDGLTLFTIQRNILFNDSTVWEQYSHDIAQDIFDLIDGIEYELNDISTNGVLFLDWLDYYNIEVKGTTYKCLLLNSEITIKSGIEENIYTEIPAETVEEYTSNPNNRDDIIADSIRARGNVYGTNIEASGRVDATTINATEIGEELEQVIRQIVPSGGAEIPIQDTAPENPQEDDLWIDTSSNDFRNIINAIYPVGSIYMSVNSTNPSTLFGGTWTAWGTGRVPVGVDTTQTEFNVVEKTGGSKELQEHYHKAGSSDTNWYAIQTSSGVQAIFDYQGVNARNTSTAGTGNSGNLQPYITCYMWKRTA